MKAIIFYLVTLTTLTLAIIYLIDHSWIINQEIGLIENKVNDIKAILDHIK